MAKTRVRAEQLTAQVATDQEITEEITSRIGSPNGAAPLDSDSRIPMTFLPSADIVELVETLAVDGGEF